MAGVRNRAVVVVGTDQSDERSELQGAATRLTIELKTLEAGGHGGGYAPGAAKVSGWGV